MKRMLRCMWLLALIVALANCGGGNQDAAAPTGPTTPSPQSPNPFPNNTPDPRIPDLSRSVRIQLSDMVNYTGLHDIASPDVFVPPLVGDALIQMDLKAGTTSGSVSGKIRLAFEDKLGLWVADLNSFDQTGMLGSGFLDIIFADDLLVVRVLAARSGDALSGTVYYRLRQSGENQCKQVIVTCETIWDNPTYLVWPYSWGSAPTSQFPNACNAPQPDTTAACRGYVQTSLSQVKVLGTFQGTFSRWWTN